MLLSGQLSLLRFTLRASQYAVLPAYEIAMRCPVLTQYMVLRPDYAMSGTGMSYGIAALLCVPCDAWYQHSVCCCPRACDAISSTDSAYGSTRVRFDTKPDSAFDASYEYAMQCLEVRQCMVLQLFFFIVLMVYKVPQMARSDCDGP